MKIAIYGVGKLFTKYKKYIRDEIVAYFDGNEKLQQTKIGENRILTPNKENINKYKYDTIIISSIKYFSEIRRKLLILGVKEEKIVSIYDYLSYIKKDDATILNCNDERFLDAVLVVSGPVADNGGALAIINLAFAMKRMQYKVMFAAPEMPKRIEDEIKRHGIDIVTSFSLYNPSKNIVSKFESIKLAFVNSYQMLPFAVKMSNYKQTILWLHDNINAYEMFFNYYSIYNYNEKISNIHIYGVSRTAVNNFKTYYPNAKIGILCYGLPDMNLNGTVCTKEDKKIVFAIVGSVQKRKGQDIFLESAVLFNRGNHKNAEFWIVGEEQNDTYSKKLHELAKKEDNILFCGPIAHEKIDEIYRNLDVLVCCSRAECLPTVVNEALMFGKTVIVIKGAGDTDYIQDGINGFYCETPEPNAIARKMEIAMQQCHNVKMCNNARKTYKNMFTMEIFEKNLKKIIDQTIID